FGIFMAAAATNHPLRPLLHTKTGIRLRSNSAVIRRASSIQAFRRSDIDGFAKRVASGELWREAWRKANDGFELFLYETRKTAERLDRRYEVSRRLSAAAQSASDRARELDRDFELTRRWRTFSLDFGRNLPMYRRQINDFLDTPLGRSFATLFLLWFTLSGWLFRFLIFATWILPFAGPLLIGSLANNLVIKGECPACKKQFIGYKNQTVRCTTCGNTVWQPRSSSNRPPSGSNSQPDIIDVEFEEK
ncbi:hypothetical protein M569_02850, partial [Genlisea aurea]